MVNSLIGIILFVLTLVMLLIKNQITNMIGHVLKNVLWINVILVIILLLLINRTVKFVTLDIIWMMEFVLNAYLAVGIVKIVPLVITVTLNSISIGIILYVLKTVIVKKKYSMVKILFTIKLYVREKAQCTGNYTTIQYASITQS
jgi:hypothetical protein